MKDIMPLSHFLRSDYRRSSPVVATALLMLIGLTGCNSRPVSTDEYASSWSQDTGPETRPGLLGGANALSLGVAKVSRDQDTTGGAALGVNAYLWRSTLDVLAFMPIASADPFGGVITTDWYQMPSVTGERFKIDAYILKRDLRSDSVHLSLFRQVQKGNTWADATTSAATTRALEDKILARALDYRKQASPSELAQQ